MVSIDPFADGEIQRWHDRLDPCGRDKQCETVNRRNALPTSCPTTCYKASMMSRPGSFCAMRWATCSWIERNRETMVGVSTSFLG